MLIVTNWRKSIGGSLLYCCSLIVPMFDNHLEKNAVLKIGIHLFFDGVYHFILTYSFSQKSLTILLFHIFCDVFLLFFLSVSVILVFWWRCFVLI